MATTKGKGNISNRGFGSMDEARKREISRQGGLASAQSNNTSNRGFASMDKDKQREISSQGGRASHAGPGEQTREKKEDNVSRLNGEVDITKRDLNSLEDEDSFEKEDDLSDAAYSETDEDEDEGLGDGKIGRSRGNELSK